MGFLLQFKFDGNFVSLSPHFWYGDRYKSWHVARQLCCRAMCNFLLRSVGQQRNNSKTKFRSNLTCGQENGCETGPWSFVISKQIVFLIITPNYQSNEQYGLYKYQSTCIAITYADYSYDQVVYTVPVKLSQWSHFLATHFFTYGQSHFYANWLPESCFWRFITELIMFSKAGTFKFCWDLLYWRCSTLISA